MLPSYELKSELARVSLHAAERDPHRKLVWVNSICILFFLIGVLGSKRGSISNQRPPPLEEIIPAIVEPLPPPPEAATQPQTQAPADQDKPETPQVVVVTPEAPNINFAVPTIGNLVVPNAVAQAPPLNPLRPAVALKSAPATLENTGRGGERPQPPYPGIALQQGQQGTVTLLLKVDEAGIIASVEVKQSSGFPILDRSAVDFVKRHWTVAPGAGERLFEATINYKLEKNL